MIIDIVLVIIIGLIAFFASRFIPSNEAIQRNETASYKSKIKLINVAGLASIAVGALLLVFYATSEDYQLLVNLGKIVFLVVIGIGLINKNLKISKAVAAYEGTVPMTTTPYGATVDAHVVTPATAGAVTPGVQTITAPVQTVQATQQAVVQPQVAAQQIGIKGGQQIGIKGGTTAPAQTQMVAAQPQIQPAAQPRIVVIKCPKCQGAMQINTAMLGQKMKCPHCGIEGRIG